jgi:hypothetical protein
MVVGMTPASCRRLALCAVLLAGLAPATAVAKDGDDDGRREARVTGTCSSGAASTLRLRSRDGEIRVDFQVKRRRAGESWRVVVVHERRVASRTSARTSGSDGSFQLRRTLGDLEGPDEVVVRAAGPRGMTCEASATLAA